MSRIQKKIDFGKEFQIQSFLKREMFFFLKNREEKQYELFTFLFLAAGRIARTVRFWTDFACEQLF